MAFLKNTIIRASIQLLMQGNRLSMNLHYSKQTTLDIDDPQELAVALEVDVIPAFAAVMSEDVLFQRVYATAVSANTTIPGYHPLENTPGDVVGQSLPSNLPAVVSLRQEEVSAKNNGRVFVPGIPESTVEDGLIDGGLITTTFEALCEALMTPIAVGAVNYVGVVLSRRLGGVNIAPVGHLITSALCRRALGNQRRRTVEARAVL